MPRVSLSFGYFRRINGNFQITDNEALSRTDFTEYSATVPSTNTLAGTLPNAGGTVTGLFDPNINPAARNVVKDASVYGKQLAHWDGIDLNVDARLRNGLFLQGGVSTGKTMTDNCEIVDDAPEILRSAVGQFLPLRDALPAAVQGAGVLYAAVRHPGLWERGRASSRCRSRRTTSTTTPTD